jgi:uncharacterized protein
MRSHTIVLVALGIALVAAEAQCQPEDARWFEPLTSRLARRLKSSEFFDSQIQIDLANAAAKGDTNQVEALLSRGADVNCLGRDGMRPLFWALIKRNFDGFRYLLKHGAEPNIVAADNEARGQTIMSLAATLDESEFLRELLSHGGNPNLVGGKTRQTPIFLGAFYRKTNNVAILLGHGADIDWKSAGGHTAFGDAVGGCSYEVALFLYHAGANPLITNKLNYCAVDKIREYGDAGVMSRGDKAAYRQLVTEFKAHGWLESTAK